MINNFTNTLDIEGILSGNSIADFNSNLPRPLNLKNTIFTLYARNGLYHIAKQIIDKKPNKHQALVPSYSCGDELEAILKAGYNIIPYKIDANLQADIDDVKLKIGKNTSLVLLTHYFGAPQKEVESIKKICEDVNILLIEDCAHVFGSTFKGRPLGTFGDVSIFSLRKFLNIPHGGALVVNNKNLNQPYFNQPNSEAVLVDFYIFLGQRNGSFPKGIPIDKIYKQIGLDYNNRHGPRLENFGGYNLAMSNFAKFLIKNFNASKIINDRISNFNRYSEIFLNNENNKVKPLISSLPDGTVPLTFPVVVKDSEIFCARLIEKNIPFCQPYWSYLHKYIDWVQYPEAKKLKRSIVSLPLDIKIGKKQLLELFINR